MRLKKVKQYVSVVGSVTDSPRLYVLKPEHAKHAVHQEHYELVTLVRRYGEVAQFSWMCPTLNAQGECSKRSEHHQDDNQAAEHGV